MAGCLENQAVKSSFRLFSC